MARLRTKGASAPKPERKVRKPVQYTDELGDRMEGAILDGMPLRRIPTEVAGAPSNDTLFRWLRDPEHPFFERFLRAWRMKSLIMADEILEIADSTTDKEKAAANRLRVDTRKWLMAKCLPKIFGERADRVEVQQGEGGGQVVVVVGGDKEYIHGGERNESST